MFFFFLKIGLKIILLIMLKYNTVTKLEKKDSNILYMKNIVNTKLLLTQKCKNCILFYVPNRNVEYSKKLKYFSEFVALKFTFEKLGLTRRITHTGVLILRDVCSLQ